MLPFERSYWVIPNQLLAGEIPASYDETESIKKLSGLVNLGIKVVINLMEEGETNHHDEPFFDYTPYLTNHEIIVHRLPIRDVSIPTKKRMKEILELIDQSNLERKAVYVHCWGGIGRTGTVVGCYLLKHGYATTSTVIQTIDYLKRTTTIADRSSPETEQQREFILDWGK